MVVRMISNSLVATNAPNEGDCIICMDPLNTNNDDGTPKEVVDLCCPSTNESVRHLFHKECVMAWLE